MVKEQKNCRIPSELVPKCPVCGGKMEVNVRKDEYFVQDAAWYDANMRYGAFMEKARGKKTLLLELGVGYNTPAIIRFPFERLTYREKNVYLVRLNRDYPGGAPENRKKTIAFREDMAGVLNSL